MELIKITDLTARLGVSSRTLRYYEEAGLIKSVRPRHEAYRFYDEAAVERLRQILVLRKLQIPIKDILRIYERPETATLVAAFTARMDELDREIAALSQLKALINSFTQRLIENGVRKISALPLLYEEISKRLDLAEAPAPDNLEALSRSLTRPKEPSILRLPSMRMLTSEPKEGTEDGGLDAFRLYVERSGLNTAAPGFHESFEYRKNGREAAMLRVPDDFVNDSPYRDACISGGLYASINLYADEDTGEALRRLIEDLSANKFYQPAYKPDGSLRDPVLLEDLISPDDRRALTALYLPVSRRLLDPTLFAEPRELPPEALSLENLEDMNPVIWQCEIAPRDLVPVNSPHLRLLENGEAEYSGGISTRVLSTEVEVRLPFRVDVEYREDAASRAYASGSSEGSLLIYHGRELTRPYGVNVGNTSVETLTNEALCFYQPVFGDCIRLPKRGSIITGVYNRVSWIIGAKQLAVIINGELRYCGTDFPYMALDLSATEPKPILIGSNGQSLKYIKSLRVSQLYCPPRKGIKEELTVNARQTNNLIPTVHRVLISEQGENYWCNGCAAYLMDCLGEKDYDYSFFAGITGDNFVQHYKFGFMGDGVSAYHQFGGDGAYFERILAKCGYSASFVSLNAINSNREMFLSTLMAYIDRGVAVATIAVGGPPFGAYVGYEEAGKTLLYVSGDDAAPQRIESAKALESKSPDIDGWIFIGEKRESVPLVKLYRDAILALPELLTTDNGELCFGAAAFRRWAKDIEDGVFDGMKPEDFNGWGMYQNFVCVLATNSGCCQSFLQKARELNPDLAFLVEVGKLYRRTGELWDELEAIGGGFNITLELLQDSARRAPVAAKLREFAEVADKILITLKTGLKGL